jgi:hypothetical protein
LCPEQGCGMIRPPEAAACPPGRVLLTSRKIGCMR